MPAAPRPFRRMNVRARRPSPEEAPRERVDDRVDHRRQAERRIPLGAGYSQGVLSGTLFRENGEPVPGTGRRPILEATRHDPGDDTKTPPVQQ
jgi:hypothetical protein